MASNKLKSASGSKPTRYASTSSAATAVTSSSASATEENERKETFAFRMSKKVAELTQVIHILFVQNHEKEVKMAALIDAYEDEIDSVISDARSRLADFENQLKDAREAGTRLETEFSARLSEAILSNDERWKLKVQSLEEQIESNNSGTNDDLARIRSQLDHVIAQRAVDSTRHARDVDEKCREIERLKLKMAELEKTTSAVTTQRETLETEITQVKRLLAESDASRDSVLARHRRLEDEISNLRRQQQQLLRNKERGSTQASQDSGADEIERLRQEIRHLKMELGNRETNFNRLFTAHQPVFVTQQPMKPRSDLTHHSQINRGDSAMTSSRYFSAAGGRSATQPSAARNRAVTDTERTDNDVMKQSATGTARTVTSAEQSKTTSAIDETFTRISIETEPVSDSTVPPPSESLYNGLPLLIDRRQRRSRQPPILTKPSVPLLAKAR